MLSIVPSNQEITSSPKKIKPIPRKSLCSVQAPKDLNMSIKKGFKVKHLKLAHKDERTKSLKVSSVKKLAKYCNSLYGIQIGGLCSKDVIPLLKIQPKIRQIEGLQLGLINLKDIDVSKKLKRLLVRFKYLKEFRRKAEVDSEIAELLLNDRSIDLVNELSSFRAEKRFPLAFHSRSLLCDDSKNTRKLMLSMRKHLSSLISVEENRSSFTLTINIPFDIKIGEFDWETLDLIRKLKGQYLLDYVAVRTGLKYGLQKILPFFEANSFNVISQLDLREISQDRASFESFLSRKDARVILDSSSIYSWDSLLSMLNFSQEMFSLYGSFIDFKDFTFDFHAPIEVKTALINHFKQKEMKWERVIFSFKTHSIGWSREDEKSCLEEMINVVCEEENREKYSEIQWNVSFTNVLEDKLAKRIENIFSVIQDFIQRQQKAKIVTRYALKIDFEGVNNKNLLSFLDLFQQIPNTISVLQLNLFPEQLNKIKKTIQSSKSPINRNYQQHLICLRSSLQSVKQLSLQAEEIKNYLIQLKEKNSFKEFFIPQLNELSELSDDYEI